jgi:hypothetical protein
LSSCLLFKISKAKTYKIINLPSVWYGCETWSLTLTEEYRFRAFENRVLIISGPGSGSGRELEKTAYEELHNLYAPPNTT